MRADDVRRQLHDNRTTFVRVADVSAEPGSPVEPPHGGRRDSHRRHAGEPERRRWPGSTEVVAAARGTPVSGVFAGRSRATIHSRTGDAARPARGALCRGTGARRRGPVRAPAGSPALDRGGQHRRPGAGATDPRTAAGPRHRDAAQADRRAAAGGGGDPLVRSAAAPRQPGRALDRLRRCEAGRAGATDRRHHSVDSSGLGAVRTQAGAGRTHHGCRRCGRRLGGG